MFPGSHLVLARLLVMRIATPRGTAGARNLTLDLFIYLLIIYSYDHIRRLGRGWTRGLVISLCETGFPCTLGGGLNDWGNEGEGIGVSGVLVWKKGS